MFDKDFLKDLFGERLGEETRDAFLGICFGLVAWIQGCSQHHDNDLCPLVGGQLTVLI